MDSWICLVWLSVLLCSANVFIFIQPDQAWYKCKNNYQVLLVYQNSIVCSAQHPAMNRLEWLQPSETVGYPCLKVNYRRFSHYEYSELQLVKAVNRNLVVSLFEALRTKKPMVMYGILAVKAQQPSIPWCRQQVPQSTDLMSVIFFPYNPRCYYGEVDCFMNSALGLVLANCPTMTG